MEQQQSCNTHDLTVNEKYYNADALVTRKIIFESVIYTISISI
jgi:hypothetical protein